MRYSKYLGIIQIDKSIIKTLDVNVFPIYSHTARMHLNDIGNNSQTNGTSSPTCLITIIQFTNRNKTIKWGIIWNYLIMVAVRQSMTK